MQVTRLPDTVTSPKIGALGFAILKKGVDTQAVKPFMTVLSFVAFCHTQMKLYNSTGELGQDFRGSVTKYMKHSPQRQFHVRKAKISLEVRQFPPPPQCDHHAGCTLAFWT